MIRFAILDPVRSGYDYADTLEQAQQRMNEIIAEYGGDADWYIRHTHDAPIVQVVINPDGSETWSNLQQ